MASKAYRENYALIKWAPIKSKIAAPAKRAGRAVYVVKDIEPYRSIITGEVIGGRRQHRDHLRAHGVVEVGNEKLPANRPPPLPDVRNDIRIATEMVRGGYRPRPGTYSED